MPHSSTSLDSLSSPSPSPEPADPSAAPADSSSELSELTEDEQEVVDGDEDDNEDDERDNEDDADGDPEQLGNASAGARRSHPARLSASASRKRRAGAAPPAIQDWYSKKQKVESGMEVEEEEEEEEMAGPPRAMEEEEDEDEGDGNGHRNDGRLSGSHANRSGFSVNTEADDDESVDDDAEAEPTFYTPKIGKLKRRRAQNGRRNEDYDEERLLEDALSLQEPDGAQSDEANEEDTNADGGRSSHITHSAPSTHTTTKTSTTTALADATGPPTIVAPAPTVSSIMGGIDLRKFDPYSNSPMSSDSSRSGSPISTTSDSPPLNQGGNKVRKGKALARTDASAGGLSALPSTKLSPTVSNAIVVTAPVDEDGEPEVDADQQSLGDQEMEPDLEMELESDLQPAHRAEALDVLATIELRFAALREKVYVEKMEALAWEEAMVTNGTHPELIHLQAELLQRRNKRLELALRKRDYEAANVTRRRKVDEAATWSWWKLARDELQTDMISETNRKRRRMERERRAVERSQPVYRIPQPPHDVPPAPTLRQIVKDAPFNQSRRRVRSMATLARLANPELTPMSHGEVMNDLEYLFQHRRNLFDPYRLGLANMGMGVPVNAPMGMGPMVQPHGFDAPYGPDGMPMGIGVGMGTAPPTFGPIGSGRNGMLPPPPPPPPPPPSFLPHPHLGVPPSHGFPSRHLGMPPNTLPHSHGQPSGPFSMEQDMGPGPSSLGQHQYFGSAGGGGYSGGNQGFGPLRRSISPVLVSGPGKQPSRGWAGSTGKGADWLRSDIHMSDMDDDGRDRRDGRREYGRDRERDKRGERERMREMHDLERERDRERDRSFHMQMQQQQLQQQHRHPVHGAPQHIHGPPGQSQVPHHHPPSHRHHHHHVVHHHHPPPPSSAATGPGQTLPPLSGQGPGHSPRNLPGRDFEPVRSRSEHSHHTEIINLSLSKPSVPFASPWKGDESPEYRGKATSSRPSTAQDERERPLAMPFVMTSTTHTRSGPSPLNGQGPAMSPSANLTPWGNGADESPLRPTSATYLGPPDVLSESPSHRYLGANRPPGSQQQARSRQSSLGLSPPRVRPLPPPSPSGPGTAYPGDMRSPHRFTQPAQSQQSQQQHQLPIAPAAHVHLPTEATSPSLKMHRPSSPIIPGAGKNGSGSSVHTLYSPRLSGPGRTGTPKTIEGQNGTITNANGNGNGNGSVHPISRAGSPPFPLAPMRVAVVQAPEKTSPRILPLPPPKMNVAQIVDGP